MMIAAATQVAATLVLVGGLSGESNQMMVTILIPLMVVTKAGLKLGIVNSMAVSAHMTANKADNGFRRLRLTSIAAHPERTLNPMAKRAASCQGVTLTYKRADMFFVCKNHKAAK